MSLFGNYFSLSNITDYFYYVGDSYSTTSTITLPSFIANNDLIIFFQVAGTASSTPPVSAVPSSFTLINTSNPAGQGWRGCLSYSTANSNSGGAVISGMTANLSYENAVLILRPNNPTAFAAGSSAQEGTAGDPADQTIVCNTVSKPLVAIGGFRNGVGSTVRTMSPTEDGSTGLNNSEIRFKIFNGNPENVTVTLNDGGAINLLHSCYISMT